MPARCRPRMGRGGSKVGWDANRVRFQTRPAHVSSCPGTGHLNPDSHGTRGSVGQAAIAPARATEPASLPAQRAHSRKPDWRKVDWKSTRIATIFIRSESLAVERG